MRGFLFGISLSIAFLVGCVASQFVVPPVRAGTQPTKWEYRCVYNNGVPYALATDTANKMGAEGWELATANLEKQSNDVFCFRRALP